MIRHLPRVEHVSYTDGVVVVTWDPEAAAHMWNSHHVTTQEAEEALNDPEAVTQSPDPASKSGQSDRVIGWSETAHALLVVIVVRYGGVLYGGNAWQANDTHRRIYEERNPR